MLDRSNADMTNLKLIKHISQITLNTELYMKIKKQRSLKTTIIQEIAIFVYNSISIGQYNNHIIVQVLYYDVTPLILSQKRIGQNNAYAISSEVVNVLRCSRDLNTSVQTQIMRSIVTQNGRVSFTGTSDVGTIQNLTDFVIS